MIGSSVGVSLGILFVAIAGTNVWLMLRNTGNRARQIRIHRFGGYLFLTLFFVMFFYMSKRVSGVTHGLSITRVIHSALAFLLLPLLFLKILIARRYKHRTGTLFALGLAIFIVSFLLVAITSFPVLWASDILGNIPLGVDISVIALAVVVFGTLFFRRAAVAPPATAVQAADNARRQSVQALGALRQPGASKSLLLLLSRIQDQTHDTRTLRFLLPQREGFQARPGQFLTFNWIVDGKAVARSYSICSSPLQTGYLEITAKRAEGGCVSVFLNQQAQIGLTVEARGPSGQFCFDESQHDKIVLIAGGSGIAHDGHASLYRRP
jgi:FAD-dependent oxidoreductase family protein